MNKRILFIGGDNRTPHVANFLQNKNYDVCIYGMERFQTFHIGANITTQLTHADAFILPIPITQNNKTVNAPYAGASIDFESIFRMCEHTTRFIGGKIPKPLCQELTKQRIPYYDYGENEFFALENALPTAEAAIEIILANTPYVIEGKKICVVGYGRIGKILAKKLKALGCHVFVATRKESQFKNIQKEGNTALYTNQLHQVEPFDIMVNTAPAPVINREVIKNQKKNTLIIDLASKPGGTDFAYAKEKGIQTIHALSLPAKHAPITAAQIIADSIHKYLDESE